MTKESRPPAPLPDPDLCPCPVLAFAGGTTTTTTRRRISVVSQDPSSHQQSSSKSSAKRSSVCDRSFFLSNDRSMNDENRRLGAIYRSREKRGGCGLYDGLYDASLMKERAQTECKSPTSTRRVSTTSPHVSPAPFPFCSAILCFVFIPSSLRHPPPCTSAFILDTPPPPSPSIRQAAARCPSAIQP